MAAFILENGRLWSDPEALALRPKPRSRKWAPKKRTGCLTCRQRRVKCDEGKPACHRCVIASRECVGTGYAVSSSPRGDDSSPGSTVLVSRRQMGMAHQPGVTVHPVGVKTNEQEMMHFYFLRSVAASDMAGVFDRKFCSRDMLQATSFHPTVWHASCALAAMYQRETLATAAQDSGADMAVAERGKLRNFALEQYNESIAGVIGIMNSDELSSTDMEVLLTTTLLFTAIASLQGDLPAAVLHVINGQRILQRWKRKLAKAQKSGAGGHAKSTSGLLTPNCVEAVMGRLISQSSCIRPKPWSEDYYKGLEAPVVSEDPFHSPEDAYYEFEPLSKAYFEIREDNKFVFDPAQKQPSVQVRRAYRAALAEWTIKFEAMRMRPGMMNSAVNREAVLVLQARQMAMEIEVQRDPAGSEMTWDEFTPQFARIVALGEQLRTSLNQQSGRVFSFSSSMMDVLFLTAVYCRDYGIRHRALQILRRHNAREGLCNSRLGYAIASGWAEVEEEPGRVKASAGGSKRDELDCECLVDVFVCGHHRVTAVAGDYRVDDVGTLTFWTKRELDLGLPGKVREIAW